MLYLIFPHGGLGHTLIGLIDYCTVEGGADHSKFKNIVGNQHQIESSCIKNISHPNKINTKEYIEWAMPNLLVSTSFNIRSRILILEMGHYKVDFWPAPTSEDISIYSKQVAETIGEKIELAGVGIKNKLTSPIDWYTEYDKIFEIDWYWNNRLAIVQYLKLCGLTPLADRIDEYADNVVVANQSFVNKVDRYYQLVDQIIAGKDEPITLTFYESSLIYAMLLMHYNKSHTDCRLLSSMPTNTQDFYNIFN